MPKKAKSRGIGKRNTGGGKSKKKAHKRAARSGFEARHIDQVWEDVRKQVNTVSEPGTRLGPVGTTDKVELDADLPGQGSNYCVACSRYFISQLALAEHERSKPHKRRVRTLKGPRPHNQMDADMAGDMGKPDNGSKLGKEKSYKKAPPSIDMDHILEAIQRI